MTVAGMNFFGYPVADWVQCAAFCWIAVQFGWWAYKTFIRRDKE